MKINFACGKQTWDGFYCVDAVAHPKATRHPDLLHVLKFDRTKLVNPLPLEDGCADELHSYHFLEHVTGYQAPALVAEWRRLLKVGGRLIIELPNLEAACRNLLAGMSDQMAMWPIYGDWSHEDEFMLHRHGYTPKTAKALLEENGFGRVIVLAPKTHGARANRDMRLEAVKC